MTHKEFFRNQMTHEEFCRKGGKASRAKLTPEQRHEAAVKAANARWKDHVKKQPQTKETPQ